MVIRLYGLPCHECGLPAEWWTDGVTLPCRCGVHTRLDLDDAIEKIRLRLCGRGATL